MLRIAYPIFLWVSLKELMTQLRDKMATWSLDEELVFVVEISAGYQWPQEVEEFAVAADNDLGAFHLILNQARPPSASPHIKASMLGLWYALYFAWANQASYAVPPDGCVDCGQWRHPDTSPCDPRDSAVHGGLTARHRQARFSVCAVDGRPLPLGG